MAPGKRWENEAKIQKLSSRSDQAGCLGAWGPGSKARKLAPGSFKIKPEWVQNAVRTPLRNGGKVRKLTPGSFKMRPTWAKNASQRVPWRSPSDPWAPKAVLGCFLVSFWTPKSSNMELKFDQTSSVYLEVSFWLFGSLWGSFGARFGGHFGLHFGLPDASCHFCEK